MYVGLISVGILMSTFWQPKLAGSSGRCLLGCCFMSRCSERSSVQLVQLLPFLLEVVRNFPMLPVCSSFVCVFLFFHMFV